MGARIFLANVGVNASHRVSSPVFADGTFEFIPIPEDRELPEPYALRYRDLRSYNNPGCDLRDYVPSRLWDWPTHNDPEFESFTYGDNCETSPRAASLKHLVPGDILFFLARLQGVPDDDASFPAQLQGVPDDDLPVRARVGKAPDALLDRNGFYLVGNLEIEEVLPDVRSRPAEDVLRRFGANAHVRRGLCNPALWDRFWVFRGSDRSRRFDKAVPVTRELARRVFTSADGSPWRWEGGRTELQVIGSYTRSCRCVLDPALPGHMERAEELWEWVARSQSL